MKQERGRGLRGALLAAAAGSFAFAGAASAQSAGAAATPGADLRRQLSELAANPQSVSELINTGRAALAVGDGEGALGFFTRASQLAPNDARVKAGLAAANARTGRPETALMLFGEAMAVGAPMAEIAAERGLAYDLLGQPARAQQDYLASLRHREDPEVRRRLALSLAISGQREAALRLLDPQLRLGDRAGHRARIMVLALTGDVRAASAAANATLPANAAQAIAPFLARLASLDPGQMAAAANLGRLPSGARSGFAGRPATTADPGALAFAGGGVVTPAASGATGLAARLPVAPAEAGATRRRPGAVNTAARAPNRGSAAGSNRTLASAGASVPIERRAERPRELAPAVPAAARTVTAAAPERLMQPHPHEPLRFAGRAASPGSAVPAEAGESADLTGTGGPRVPQAVLSAEANEAVLSGGSAAAASAAPAVTPSAAPVRIAEAQLPAAPPAQESRQAPASEEPADAAPAALAVWNSAAAPAQTQPARTPAQSSATARQATPRPGFADVVAVVSELPTEVPASAAAPATQRASAQRPPRAAPQSASTRTAAAGSASTRTAAAARPAAERPAPAAHPSRIWVQLGMSSNRSAFGYEISRIRRAAPDLLKDRTPHVAPSGGSHRLLVGPFPTSAAARTFINGLKQKEVDAIPWTSPAGTQVERFAAGR